MNFNVYVQLCTDKDTDDGGVWNANTDRNGALAVSLYNGNTEKWEQVQPLTADLVAREPTIHKELLLGDLTAATKIKIDYDSLDILCIEKLTLESMDGSIKYDLIQVTEEFRS